MRRRAPLVLALIVVLTAAASAAQPDEIDAKAQRIFTSIMSPYCPGLLLADCPSPAAFTLRLEVRQRLIAGESPAAIEQDLYNRFGEVLRAVPEPERWGLVAWIVPPVAFVLSLAAVMWFLARVPGQSSSPAPERLATDPALEERLQHELDDVD
jgi:cytochrome c-type biogenesis protein CcmH